MKICCFRAILGQPWWRGRGRGGLSACSTLFPAGQCLVKFASVAFRNTSLHVTRSIKIDMRQILVTQWEIPIVSLTRLVRIC
jgi:hypothetical protein